MGKRVGGVIFVKADSVQFDAKGQFEYNLGVDKKDPVYGVDKLHGYKVIPQECYLSGEFTDNADLDLKNDLLGIENATVTLELANGKLVSFVNATFTGEGNIQTDEGNISVKFTADSATEV